MEEIIKKRSDLLNYFFNESKNYSKVDILNREFAALNFSPREEYIDAFTTDYDDILTPIESLEENQDEVYIKGIIIDVDMKKNYCIIHIQNKGDNISISIDESALRRYNQYLNVGDVILVKGHTYNGKVYLHLMINYTSNDAFLMEKNYLNGISKIKIDDYDDSYRSDTIALVNQAKYFKSKKGTNCLRLQVYEKGTGDKTYITCTVIPKGIIAGMFISYLPSNNSAFCNNVQEVQL